MNKNVKEKINNVEIDNDNLSNLKKQIIEMVNQIENLWTLEQILQFTHNMTKED